MDEPEECAICQLPILGTFCRGNLCSHQFHKQCIVQWTKQSSTCPCCRDPVEKLLVIDSSGKTIETLSVEVAAPRMEDWDELEMDYRCMVCLGAHDPHLLLLCDGCDTGYHTYCDTPRLSDVPSGDWFCPTCRLSHADSSSSLPTTSTRRSASARPLPRSALATTVRRGLAAALLRSGNSTSGEEESSEDEETDLDGFILPDNVVVRVNGEGDRYVLDDDTEEEDLPGNIPSVTRRRRAKKRKRATTSKKSTTKKRRKTKKGKRRRKGARRGVNRDRVAEHIIGRRLTAEERAARGTEGPSRLSVTGAGLYVDDIPCSSRPTLAARRSHAADLFDQPLLQLRESPSPSNGNVENTQTDDLLGGIMEEQVKTLAPSKFFRQSGDKLVPKTTFFQYQEKTTQKIDEKWKKALGLNDCGKTQEAGDQQRTLFDQRSSQQQPNFAHPGPSSLKRSASQKAVTRERSESEKRPYPQLPSLQSSEHLSGDRATFSGTSIKTDTSNVHQHSTMVNHYTNKGNNNGSHNKLDPRKERKRSDNQCTQSDKADRKRKLMQFISQTAEEFVRSERRRIQITTDIYKAILRECVNICYKQKITDKLAITLTAQMSLRKFMPNCS